MTRSTIVRYGSVAVLVALTLAAVAGGRLVEAPVLGMLAFVVFVWAGDGLADRRYVEAMATRRNTASEPTFPTWVNTPPKDAQRPSVAQREAWDFTFGHLVADPEDAA